MAFILILFIRIFQELNSAYIRDCWILVDRAVLSVSPRILVRCLAEAEPLAPGPACPRPCARTWVRRARVGRCPRGELRRLVESGGISICQAVGLCLSAHHRCPGTAPAQFLGSLQSPTPGLPDRLQALIFLSWKIFRPALSRQIIF